jgi:tetratricopeptide (TPR) repeat protein
VLLVTGEPGIGKTRFVHELATLVRVSRANVLRGECYAEGGVPYAPVAQLIREGLAALGQRGDTFTLPDLVVADLLTLAPDLHARYPGVPPNPPLDPHAEQQRLFESVVALCVALVQATRAPLLLVMEDVHWADGGTLFLLRHLARRGRSANLRLLMILTYREAELDQACCLSDVLLDLNRERIATRIKLERLSREQTRDMLAVMLAEEVTPEFLEAIYRETEGNPFFVEEVCKALIEEGKLYRENGRWHRPSVEEIQVPQSVRLAIQARVGKLPAQAQDVLRLAAVVGREFDFGTLRQASDLGEEMLIDALEAAERAQLIGEVQARSGREAFAFAHALIPTALRENVSGLRRHRLHRRVAAAIEALRPDDCEALAYHYGEAGDEGQARTYYIRAAERARKLYANEEAVRFYSEALALIPADHADRFDLLSARAQVYDILARREAQHADVEAMLALAEKLDDDARRCDALIALADFHLKTEHVRAREPAERAAEIARKMGDRVREGFALRSLGYGAWNWLDLAQSRSALEAAVARFREADLPGEAAVCLHMLSLTLSDLGEHAAAEGAVEQAVALSRQAGDRRHEAISLRRLAIVHIDQFRHAQALPFAAAALALHRELGDQAEECHALNVMGIIMAFLSRPEEAQAYLSQSLAMAEAIGLNVAVPHAAENLTWFHFRRQGEYEAGLAFVEERLAKARLANDEFLVAALLLLKATLLTWLGQYAAALELAQSGLPMVEALSGQTYQVKVLSFMGFLQAKLGNHERARQYLDAALERAGEEGRNKDAARVLTSRAYQAWLEGGEANLHLGLEQAQRAIALLTSAEYGLDLADALDVTAQLHLALGEEEAALTSSSEAMRLVAAWPFVPEGYLFTHACALRAARRAAEADDYLRRAYECVMLVASKTHDPALHRSWLEDVQVNRAILAAWAQRP